MNSRCAQNITVYASFFTFTQQTDQQTSYSCQNDWVEIADFTANFRIFTVKDFFAMLTVVSSM